jgi:hypothetical protein
MFYVRSCNWIWWWIEKKKLVLGLGRSCGGFLIKWKFD